MKIIQICAGLANLTFQYIFGRFIEETTGEEVIFDDLYFHAIKPRVDEIRNKQLAAEENIKGIHNGYELEYVFPNIKKPLLLSQCIHPDIWRFMTNSPGADFWPQTLTAGYLLKFEKPDLLLCAEYNRNYKEAYELFTGKKIYALVRAFTPQLATLTGNTYFIGDWINPSYFNKFKNKFINELAFKPIISEQNKKYENKINTTMSVGVHIRRGDYIHHKLTTDPKYFFDIISKIKTEISDANFFIFSNDINWCKKNQSNLGLPINATTFVEGNFDYKNNYIDMQLMALCKVLIVNPGSAFSLLAALLNKQKGFSPIYSHKDFIKNKNDEKISLKWYAENDPNITFFGKGELP